MKPQDIFFFLVVIVLIVSKKEKLAVFFGILSLLLAIPLFAKWIFFTAERLTWYAAGFFLLGIFLSMISKTKATLTHHVNKHVHTFHGLTAKQKAFVSVILGTLLTAAIAAVTKKGIHEIPPLSFAFVRFCIASLCVLPFFLKRKKTFIAEIRTVAPVTLFATANIIFFVTGLKLTTANISQIIYAGVPFLTGVIAYIVLKEKLATKKVIGIVVGFIGVLLVTLMPFIEKGKAFSGNISGNLLLMCAAVAWSFYMVYSKKLQRKYSPFLISSSFILITAVLLFPFFLYDLKVNFGWWHHVTGWGIFAVVYMAIIATIVTYFLVQYSIKHGGSVFAAMLFYLVPVLGVLVDFLVLGEKLTPVFTVGGMLALFGIFLVMRN